MRVLHLLTILGLVLAGQAATAQQHPTKVTAEAGASWTHKPTGLALPSAIAGLTRGNMVDATSDGQDVSIQYDDPARDLLAFVWVYKPSVSDVAIWFDQAARGIAGTPGHGAEGATLPPPSPFARPGAGAPSGLRLAMDVPGPGFKSTALAVAPIGEWLVKVRMSSRSLDRAALDSRLDTVLAALTWPAESGTPRAAAAVLPCPSPLKTKQAKIVRDDIGQVLMNSVAFISMEREGPPPVYCREPGLPEGLGAYRADGDGNSYVIALNDAGDILSVGPALSLDALMGGGGRSRSYSMTKVQHGSTGVLPCCTLVML